MEKLRQIIRWIGGYPHVEGVNAPPEPPKTHYVMFLVEGEAYTTEDLSQEAAELMAKQLGGIVMPKDLKDMEG